MYLADGATLVSGTPSTIAVFLTTPLSPTNVVSLLTAHESYLDEYSKVLNFIHSYEKIGKVSSADVNAVNGTLEGVIPDSINIRAFTTEPTVNNFDVFMSHLHKRAGKLSQTHETLESVKTIHSSLYGDTEVFSTLSYYLSSVERWLETAPDINILNADDDLLNAVEYLYPDVQVTTENAVSVMVSPYFTDAIKVKANKAKITLRNLFQNGTDGTFDIFTAQEQTTETKNTLRALLRVYKHWYTAAGTITTLR